MKVLKGGQVYFEGKFQQLDLAFDSGVICGISPEIESETPIFIRDCRVIPGLIDLHTHGCMGMDFADSDPKTLLEAYLKSGTTSLLATLVSLKQAEYRQIDRILPHIGQTIVGLNLEGPFIAQNKRGSHNPQNLSLISMDFARDLWKRSGGNIKLMTAAPELDEIEALLSFAKGRFALSLGHTECDYQTAAAAIAKGYSHCTHLFNAMPPMHHRNPSVVGACLESAVTKELICDGYHVNDSLIRAMLKGYGGEIAMISDSISPCGMPDGTYALGGLAVTVRNHCATLSDGTIAGSCATLFDCLRHSISIGCDLSTAIDSATIVPAKAIGLEGLGKIAVGYNADLLVIDQDFALHSVFKRGVIV